MTATIHDVARIAGVGIGTVSRVINNRPNVKPGTRERVLDAIRELQYIPDPIARSMISKRTGSIGIVVPFFTRPFFMEVLRGIEMSLAQFDKDLVLYNVETDAQRDRYFSEVPMHRKVDGLVVLSLTPEDAIARWMRDVEMPVVLLDAYSSYLTSIVVDNVDGAYQAVTYLIEKGHRRIGFINGTIEGHFKFNQANDRLIGLHRAFGEAGIQFEPELVMTTEWNRLGGRQAALQLLTRDPRPTAIFAASDIQAVGVLEAARLLGLVVPDDLSVIGYDGIEVSELLELTTIQQPMPQMGTLGVNKLMELIKHPQQPPALFRLNATLVERRTTSARLSILPGETRTL
jgi:DNA-binding LacI/PurR family transcriptional regulator